MELISDKLSETLNIDNEVTVVPEVIEQTTELTPSPEKSVADLKREGEIQEDYEFAREKLRDVAKSGAEVLNNALTVGSDSSNPRLLEASAAIMNQITSAAKELLETQKSMKNLSDEIPGVQIQNNTAYIGTTKELLEMMKAKE
jgi:hypothetical protein